tara:strand:+ start:488 stop:889 length:402 start_codon:yes stop_codon:yes gene_type:complete
MKEEFHGVIKLITGEEIFALISIEQTDEDPIIMLQSPVIMKMLSNGTGQYVKIKPWLELPEEDLYLIKPDKIITMSEVKDQQVIHFYERYLNDDQIEIVFDGQVNLSDQIGYISTVEQSRKLLEELYKINKET